MNKIDSFEMNYYSLMLELCENNVKKLNEFSKIAKKEYFGVGEGILDTIRAKRTINQMHAIETEYKEGVKYWSNKITELEKKNENQLFCRL